MKIIKPQTIGDAELTASNVPENDQTEWTTGGSFATDDLCMVTTTANGASVASHRIYKSVHTGTNSGHDPTLDTTGTNWVEVSGTNRFKMFTNIVQDQTQLAGGITSSIVVASVVNSLGFINVDAESIGVIVTDSVEGIVYNQTYSMTSDSGIQDWYAYFFEPIVRRNTLTLTDLPPYAGATIDISINDTGTAKCGACIVGQFADLGFSQYNASIGIIDYSVKSTDDNGRVTIIPGDYIDTLYIDVVLNTDAVGQVKKTLTELRTEPVVWVPQDDNSDYSVFGYYREFDIVVTNPTLTRCSLEIEGLV